MSGRIHFLLLPACIAGAAHTHAAIYHTVESAQRACFPEHTEFTPADVKLTREQMKAIEQASKVHVRLDTQRVWKASRDGQFVGWFLVDNAAVALVGEAQLAHVGAHLRVFRRREAGGPLVEFGPQFAERDGGRLTRQVEPARRIDVALPRFCRDAPQPGWLAQWWKPRGRS